MGDNFFNTLNKVLIFDKENNLLDNFLKKTSEILNAGLIFINTEGSLIKQFNTAFLPFSAKNDFIGEIKKEKQLISQLNLLNENKFNITLDNLYTTIFDKAILKQYYGIFLPIIIKNERLGTLIIYKKDEKFFDVENLCIYITNILGLIIYNNKNIENLEKNRQKYIIKVALGALSYTELEAIIATFENLKGQLEGILIASKIADTKGITRSVIVNALRKLESAEVIETRSLGAKGTYIKVLNKFLISEINKLKK